MTAPQTHPDDPQGSLQAESTPPSAPPPQTIAARELWRNTNLSERELKRMHSGIPIQCQFCVGQLFRRSRLRAADLSTLLLMRYPVRCVRCAQRQAVSFTVAGISVPSPIRRHDTPNAKASYSKGSRR